MRHTATQSQRVLDIWKVRWNHSDCVCMSGEGQHGGKCQWFKTMRFSLFLRVNWNPTQHVAAFFCLPPAWLPVPSGLFVETKSELHTKFFVLCSSWKSLSEGFSPEPQREVSVGFNREYLRKKITFWFRFAQISLIFYSLPLYLLLHKCFKNH